MHIDIIPSSIHTTMLAKAQCASLLDIISPTIYCICSISVFILFHSQGHNRPWGKEWDTRQSCAPWRVLSGKRQCELLRRCCANEVLFFWSSWLSVIFFFSSQHCCLNCVNHVNIIGQNTFYPYFPLLFRLPGWGSVLVYRSHLSAAIGGRGRSQLLVTASQEFPTGTVTQLTCLSKMHGTLRPLNIPQSCFFYYWAGFQTGKCTLRWSWWFCCVDMNELDMWFGVRTWSWSSPIVLIGCNGLLFPLGGERQWEQRHAHTAMSWGDGPHDPSAVWGHDGREAQDHRQPSENHLPDLPGTHAQLLSSGKRGFWL